MNPIQQINELKAFMANYKGNNAQAEAMQMIKQSGINQKELNDLQRRANELFTLGQQMGLIK